MRGKSRVSLPATSELKALMMLGMKYLAKDREGQLCAFTHEPDRDKILGRWMDSTSASFNMDLPRYLIINCMVNWKDSKPMDILAAIGDAEQ